MKHLKTNVIFLIFPFFLCMSIKSYTPDNLHETPKKINETKQSPKTQNNTNSNRASFATIERLLAKTVIETGWSGVKEYNNKALNKKQTETVDFYELGKIFSVMLMDEFLPNTNATTKQKLAELILPTTISFVIVNSLKNSNKITQKKLMQLSTQLSQQLIFKLLMVRLFFKPGTKKYDVTDLFARLFTFMDYNPDKNGLFKYFNITRGLERITLDQIRISVMHLNLGIKLNRHHRKKAISKSAQTILKPLVQQFL